MEFLKTEVFLFKTACNEQYNERMKDNSHQIIKEQFELIDSTFSLMEETVNKLNIIEVKLDTTKNELNTTNAKINIMENNIKDLMDMKIRMELI